MICRIYRLDLHAPCAADSRQAIIAPDQIQGDHHGSVSARRAGRHHHAPTIRWAPTASNSSNTRIRAREELHALFTLMGYAPVARHKTKKITVYRQGDINYLVNEEPGTHGFDFVAAHGPCAPSMAFRVVDAQAGL